MDYSQLSEACRQKIAAELRKVYAYRCGGPKLKVCLMAAYDRIAAVLIEAEQLTDELFEVQLPAMVHDAAVKFGWIPYPPLQASSQRNATSVTTTEPVPESKLTESFGRYKVPEGYRARFTQVFLADRIAYWEAEAWIRGITATTQQNLEGDARIKAAAQEPIQTGFGPYHGYQSAAMSASGHFLNAFGTGRSVFTIDEDSVIAELAEFLDESGRGVIGIDQGGSLAGGQLGFQVSGQLTAKFSR